MKDKIYKLVEIISIILLVTLMIIAILVIKKKYFETSVFAMSQDVELLHIKEQDDYNLDEIIKENTSQKITETIETKEQDVEFTTIYKNSDKIATGTIQVIQDGMDGKESITIKKTYINGELTNEEVVSTRLIKSQMEKIVQVGTGPASLKYTINIGDKMYVTSSLLAIYLEPTKESRKTITISKNEEVSVLQIDGEWLKVKYGNYTGWTKKECLTKTSPNVTVSESGTENNLTKDQILKTVSKDMQLNKPSGLSLEQFKKVLTGNSQDKKNVFNENYQYFYYAEQQYNVNGIFLAAVAIHESNWGTSAMAQNKKNLFGYGAYDRNPSDNAYVFDTYAEGIDLLARVFAKYYLNPPGTIIYNNEKASGSHYNGPTVSGVNEDYATDKNWSNAVYKWMQYLYDRI